MKPNEEIMEFLKENPTFYLATVDGYLPRVRPIGFAMWYNGHLCIALGKHKAAYKQLLDNTNLEICAANDRGEWLRVQGTANFDNSPEAQAAAFQVMPQLADMYNEETGNKLGIVYLDHLSAKLFSMSGVVKDIMNYRYLRKANAPVCVSAYRGIFALPGAGTGGYEICPYSPLKIGL